MKETLKCHICKSYFDPKKTTVTVVRGKFKGDKMTFVICSWCAKNIVRYTSTQ